MADAHLTDVSFTNLHLPETLARGIADAGFERCTPIQAQTLPRALAGFDVAGQAQTGTGKTAAFLVALYSRLLRAEIPPTRKANAPLALIIAPTRELAVQIHHDAEILGQYTGLRLGLAFGGVDYEKQRRHLEEGVDILIGTPGRLIDFYKQHVFDLRSVQALVLAVVFIYMILASQFGRFLQPFAIMASLPLALIGVVVALLAWRTTLNMFSIIGFILLMGLVTKNAILLVDFANQARAAGMERAQALLKAAEIRLRPILMTTLAMVFGMIPLAVSVSEGAEQRAPMAHAVIGGVIASTLLTLIVVPVLYTLLDDLTARLRRRRPAA